MLHTNNESVNYPFINICQWSNWDLSLFTGTGVAYSVRACSMENDVLWKICRHQHIHSEGYGQDSRHSHISTHTHTPK